ncbi:hypothetical protein AB0E69_19055 [Kribbella sp. NPDC026611]
MNDPKQVVRRGYDVLSRRYDESTGAETKYALTTGHTPCWSQRT